MSGVSPGGAGVRSPSPPAALGQRTVDALAGEQRTLAGLRTEQGAHRVVQIGQLLEHPAEDLAHRIGHPVDGRLVDVAGHLGELATTAGSIERTISTNTGNASRSRRIARRPADCGSASKTICPDT